VHGLDVVYGYEYVYGYGETTAVANVSLRNGK